MSSTPLGSSGPSGTPAVPHVSQDPSRSATPRTGRRGAVVDLTGLPNLSSSGTPLAGRLQSKPPEGSSTSRRPRKHEGPSVAARSTDLVPIAETSGLRASPSFVKIRPGSVAFEKVLQCCIALKPNGVELNPKEEEAVEKVIGYLANGDRLRASNEMNKNPELFSRFHKFLNEAEADIWVELGKNNALSNIESEDKEKFSNFFDKVNSFLKNSIIHDSASSSGESTAESSDDLHGIPILSHTLNDLTNDNESTPEVINAPLKTLEDAYSNIKMISVALDEAQKTGVDRGPRAGMRIALAKYFTQREIKLPMKFQSKDDYLIFRDLLMQDLLIPQTKENIIRFEKALLYIQKKPGSEKELCFPFVNLNVMGQNYTKNLPKNLLEIDAGETVVDPSSLFKGQNGRAFMLAALEHIQDINELPAIISTVRNLIPDLDPKEKAMVRQKEALSESIMRERFEVDQKAIVDAVRDGVWKSTDPESIMTPIWWERAPANEVLPELPTRAFKAVLAMIKDDEVDESIKEELVDSLISWAENRNFPKLTRSNELIRLTNEVLDFILVDVRENIITKNFDSSVLSKTSILEQKGLALDTNVGILEKIKKSYKEIPLGKAIPTPLRTLKSSHKKESVAVVLNMLHQQNLENIRNLDLCDMFTSPKGDSYLKITQQYNQIIEDVNRNFLENLKPDSEDYRDELPNRLKTFRKIADTALENGDILTYSAVVNGLNNVVNFINKQINRDVINTKSFGKKQFDIVKKELELLKVHSDNVNSQTNYKMIRSLNFGALSKHKESLVEVACTLDFNPYASDIGKLPESPNFIKGPLGNRICNPKKVELSVKVFHTIAEFINAARKYKEKNAEGTDSSQSAAMVDKPGKKIIPSILGARTILPGFLGRRGTQGSIAGPSTPRRSEPSTSEADSSTRVAPQAPKKSAKLKSTSKKSIKKL